MARLWSLPAPSWRWRAIPTASSCSSGKPRRSRRSLPKHPALQAASRLVHADIAVRMEDKPSQALRYGRRKSSMWLAIDAVKKKEADMVVSAGNTGALMAMSKFELKMLPGIERPAIAALWPTLRGELIVLDVGASIGADAEHLVDLAVMGAATARILLGLEAPDRRASQYRRGGGEGSRAGARSRPHPAREAIARSRLCGLRRRRRHRHGQGRCGGHRRLCRQHRAQDRRRHRPPDRRNICGTR